MTRQEPPKSQCDRARPQARRLGPQFLVMQRQPPTTKFILIAWVPYELPLLRDVIRKSRYVHPEDLTLSTRQASATKRQLAMSHEATMPRQSQAPSSLALFSEPLSLHTRGARSRASKLVWHPTTHKPRAISPRINHRIASPTCSSLASPFI